LVELGGNRTVYGMNGLTSGKTEASNLNAALAKATAQGFEK
jgi:hypothetical protein